MRNDEYRADGDVASSPIYVSLLAAAERITDPTSDEAGDVEANINAELDAGGITRMEAARLHEVLNNATGDDE